jgi:hypothetical protein
VTSTSVKSNRSYFTYKSYFEFDMRVLGCCCVPRNKSEIYRLFTECVDSEVVSRRVDFLVKQGLLVGCLLGRQRLNGRRCSSTVYYTVTDGGSQALFYYRASKRFYDGEKQEATV